jgi:hypothetical protein
MLTGVIVVRNKPLFALQAAFFLGGGIICGNFRETIKRISGFFP